jgi:hypothetical protein
MTALDEYSEWDKRVLGPDAKLVRDDADAMRDELLAELAKWQEEARSYCQSASYHRQKREQAEAENERLRGIMGICSGPCHSYTAERYIVKVHEVVAELAALKARRCGSCKSWDAECAEEVAAVWFAWCKNGMATKEFKSEDVSEGWLCPLWTAREDGAS